MFLFSVHSLTDFLSACVRTACYFNSCKLSEPLIIRFTSAMKQLINTAAGPTWRMPSQVYLTSERRLHMVGGGCRSAERASLCHRATLTTKDPLSLCEPGQRSCSSQSGEIKDGSSNQSFLGAVCQQPLSAAWEKPGQKTPRMYRVECNSPPPTKPCWLWVVWGGSTFETTLTCSFVTCGTYLVCTKQYLWFCCAV